MNKYQPERRGGGGEGERFLELLVQLVGKLGGHEAVGRQRGRRGPQAPQHAHAAGGHGALGALRARYAALCITEMGIIIFTESTKTPGNILNGEFIYSRIE